MSTVYGQTIYMDVRIRLNSQLQRVAKYWVFQYRSRWCVHLLLCVKICVWTWGCAVGRRSYDDRPIVVVELSCLLKRSVLYHKLGAVCSSESGDSSVDIVTRQWAGRYGVRTRQGQEISVLFKLPSPALGPTQLTIQRASASFPGWWVLSCHYLVLMLRMCGVKPLPPLRLHSMHRDSFTFLCVYLTW